MAAISQQLADITVLSIVVRILLSTFCAGTLGFERERHNQAAGFRTYIIVSDASALVMMTNIFVAGIGETGSLCACRPRSSRGWAFSARARS